MQHAHQRTDRLDRHLWWTSHGRLSVGASPLSCNKMDSDLGRGRSEEARFARNAGAKAALLRGGDEPPTRRAPPRPGRVGSKKHVAVFRSPTATVAPCAGGPPAKCQPGRAHAPSRALGGPSLGQISFCPLHRLTHRTVFAPTPVPTSLAAIATSFLPVSLLSLVLFHHGQLRSH